MLHSPKRTKYRKMQRGKRRGVAFRGSSLAFGDFGLKSLENVWITANQIEACRVAIQRKLKKGGHVWIRLFPDHPVSKKPAETRMGKGKGATEFWVAVVKRGKVLFEIAGVEEELARAAFTAATHKLPIRTRFVSAKEGGV